MPDDVTVELRERMKLKYTAESKEPGQFALVPLDLLERAWDEIMRLRSERTRAILDGHLIGAELTREPPDGA